MQTPTLKLSTHKPRKRFGQHFLDDPLAIAQILDCIDPKPSDCLIEIGPGLGALTQPLLERVSHLTLIEIDRDLITTLQAMASRERLSIHNQDVLRFDLKAFVQNHNPHTLVRIVGNLPYNISTPLVFHLLEHAAFIFDMHFMFQKEVAARLVAQPGDTNYGRLSVMTQYFCDNTLLLDVGPEAFRPPPQVDSAFIRLKPYQTPPFVAHTFSTFAQIVQRAFNQRRKTLRNTLGSYFDTKGFTAAGIDPSARPQTLSVADFVRLSNTLNQATLS